LPILNNFGPIVISNTNSTSITLDNCAVENVIGVGSAKIYVNNKMSILGKVKFQDANNVSFGMNGSVITASALAGSGANFVLSNSNGISFGTTGSVVTASYTSPTDYFSSNQSTLLQLTANNSLSLGTSYTSHTHSQYLNTSQSTLFLTNQSVQPISISASNISTILSMLQLGSENGLTLYLSNGSILGSYTDSGGAGGDGINRISAGTQIAGLTQTIVLSNSNNVSFGMSNNSVVTASASYSQPTDYISTAQSSLFQQTSLMSNYLGTDYTSHSHSQYINTSQSSLFQATSDNSLSLGTDYTSHTHSQYVNTSQSSVFQQTSLMSNYLGTAATQSFRHTSADTQLLFTSQSSLFQATSDNSLSLGTGYTTHTHSQYINTNQSSLFALTANDSLSLGTGYTTHTHSQYLNTSQSSIFEQSSHTTAFALVSHSHGNPTLALTNISGSTASNSGGFTLSLSANPAGGADGYNILAAGTQTANTTGTVVLSNSNGMSFGMSNSSIITASYTVPTDYISTGQSSLFFQTSNSSLFELSSHTTIFLTTQSGQAFSAGAASSVFQTLSFQDSNGVSFSNNAGGIRVSHALQFTSNTSAITANAINTSQSSLFQHTSATSAITSNALNTSQSSLFQHTSATSAITSNALNTSVSRVVNIVAATNNTGGGTASLSNNVSFSNANGMTFYTSAGSAIVASYSVPTLTNSSLTMQAGASTLSSVSRIAFVDSNGVSFGASTSNNGSITITATVATTYAASNHSHGNPTLALTNLTGTTASASNGFTLSLSAAAPGAGGGIVLANSQTTYTSGTVNLSGAGAITIQSTTGQSFQISVPATSSLSATGIVSISTNGSTVSIGASQSNQNISLYALGNTTQNSSTVLNASVLSLNGLQGITVGFSNGSIQLSGATGGTGGGGGIALANSQTTYTSGTAHLSGAGAITIQSTTGQSYIVSAPGSSSISGTGHVSISVNASTISIGAPSPAISGSNGSFSYSTLTFGNLNNVSFYTSNGSMVASINAAGGPTLSNFQHPENMWTSLGALGQGSLSIKHMYVPFNVTGTQMNIGMSVSGATNTSATTASANVSLWIGIYTLNGSSLSLASSGSANNGFQWSQSASSTGNTSINSMRLMSVPINVNMTPGEYWMGVVISSATTYTSAGFTFYGGNLINNAATAAVFAPIGSGTTASSMAIPFQGIYTAATAVGPSSMSKAHINFSSASNVQRANLYCQILNNTY